MRYYFNAFRNYANFNGRATRKEYWLFILFHYIFIMGFAYADGALGLYSPELKYGLLTIVYFAVTALPAISLQVRRLHDIGKSGSWWFFNFFPFLSIYILILNLRTGDVGVNGYGVPSKYDVNYKPKAENTFSAENNETHTCERCNRACDVLTEIEMKDEYGTRYRKVCQSCLAELYSLIPNPVSKPKNKVPKIVFCRKCGEKLIEGSTFCGKCGTEIIRGNENDEV